MSAPISMEAVELLCDLLEHERAIERHLLALGDIALDLAATGNDGHLAELHDAQLVRPCARFAWQGDRALTLLTLAGQRAARLADDTLHHDQGGHRAD